MADLLVEMEERSIFQWEESVGKGAKTRVKWMKFSKI